MNRHELTVRVVTAPTVVVRRIRREAEAHPDLYPRLSQALKVAGAVVTPFGVLIGLLGAFQGVPGVLLVGALLVSGGLAAWSLGGLLER